MSKEIIQSHDQHALMTGMFLSRGFFSEPLSSKEVDQWQGEIGVMCALAEYVPPLHAALQKAESLDFESPGLVDYEVTEELGKWIRENDLTTMPQFLNELNSRLTRFYECDCSELMKAASRTVGREWNGPTPDFSKIKETEDTPSMGM